MVKTNAVRDLGIILDERWTFNEHLGHILSKSFRTLGFIRRITYNFTSLPVVTYLFKTLILPTLTYCSVIWSPLTQDKFAELNSILTRFLRYASSKNGNPMAWDDHDFSEISTICNINRMESIHHFHDINFVLENLKGNIKGSTFNRRFQLRNLSYCLRNHRPYLEFTHSRNFISHLPAYRLVGRWNTIDQELRNHLLEVNNKDALKEFCLRHF